MDNKFDGKRISYGLTNELFANRKGEGETIILGGIGTGSSRWARVLTRRAAHQLWYRLTWLLFPEKSTQVTGARHLWIALDKALYPAGWQGPSTHHGKLN